MCSNVLQLYSTGANTTRSLPILDYKGKKHLFLNAASA